MKPLKHLNLRIAILRAKRIARRAFSRAMELLINAGLWPRDAERLVRLFAMGV